MAKRRNKDKEIEELKARNEYLENKSRILSSWRGLSTKNMLVLSLLWVFLIILVMLLFSIFLINTTKNPISSYSDYERITGALDGRMWKVSESTKKSLSSLFPPSSGIAKSVKDGENLSLIIYADNNDKTKINFSYKEGRILSFYSGRVMEVEYTETVYGGGRTLSLLYNGGKIVFKEKR